MVDLDVKIHVSPELFTLPDRLRAGLIDARNASVERARFHVERQTEQVKASATGGTLERIEQRAGKSPAVVVLHSGTPADIIERGRRPNKPIPRWSVFEPILRRWAAAVGFSGNLWLLAQKIKREGIKGRYPYKKAVDALMREMPLIVGSILDKVK